MIRALAVLLLIALPASAQEESATPTLKRSERVTYEDNLKALAEVLGNLHHVRPLCHPEDGERWRERMMELIRIEKPSTQQKDAMVARFNDGYDAAGKRFPQCTPGAETFARERAAEGEAITRRLAERITAAP